MEFYLLRDLSISVGDFENLDLKKMEFLYGKLIDTKNQEAKAIPGKGDSKWHKKFWV